MKTIVDPKDYQDLLARWRGAKAAVWLFHLSRKRMAINLSRADQIDAIYIVAIGCEHISGPFRWEKADITILSEPPNQWGETHLRVIDSQAGFELLCTDVAVLQGSDGAPPDPFDNFVDGT